MGRRKKEPRSVHREQIALVAQQLFIEKGMEATSMDEIANVAGYSKATLYVYFESKEEIRFRTTYQCRCSIRSNQFQYCVEKSSGKCVVARQISFVVL